MADIVESNEGTEIKPTPSAGEETHSWKRWIVETAILLALALVVAQGVKTFVVQPFTVPTGSMEPTIAIGNYLMAEKITYRFIRSPKYGDVVVFKDPEGQYSALIKRVIAVGGQTVDVKDNAVWVDGVKLDEPYTHGKPSMLDIGTLKMPVTVPDGYIWVMGDNRTNSADSRYFGPVPLSNVLAHAVWTYWPVSAFGKLN